MRNNRKIISFDLDGTLVSARFGDMVWNHGIPIEYAKKYSLDFDDARKIVINEYKTLGDEDLLWYDIEYWLKRFNLSVSSEELLKRYEDYIVPAKNAKEVLERLEERYTLIVASNAARIFVEKELTHTGLASFFKRIISATSDFGMVKKGEDFYKRLCSELNADVDDFIHIGDHPVFDYMAPISLGIKAYLFKGQDPSFSIYHTEEVDGKRISNFLELEALL
ncbi:MAG TPA: HAD family hydrolase [Syntrophorhabdaceae bacterium]|nr:HAD family hydrolase [Syntrophorhabdaceae bacterium]